jgi:hypothetical protein
MAIRKIRGETITLATSRAFATVRGIPPGFNVVELDVPSSTLEAITVGFGPRIAACYFYDQSVPVWIDYLDAAVGRNTAKLIDLSAMQTADRLYVGLVRRAEGLSVDVTGTNSAGTATIVGEYPDKATGNTWTDLSVTDGTNSTRTLAQDGLITWTVPTGDGWVPQTLKDAQNENSAAVVPVTEALRWVRFRPSAALTDTSITVAGLVALMNNVLNALTPNVEGQDLVRIVTNSGGMPPNRFPLDTSVYGGLELASASITTAAHVNWLEDR